MQVWAINLYGSGAAGMAVVVAPNAQTVRDLVQADPDVKREDCGTDEPDPIEDCIAKGPARILRMRLVIE